MFGLLRLRKKPGRLLHLDRAGYNIVSPTASHFSSRMSNQNRVLHDLGRDLAVIYDRREWVMTELSVNDSPDDSDREEYYQDIWSKYFSSEPSRAERREAPA